LARTLRDNSNRAPNVREGLRLASATLLSPHGFAESASNTR
jgi:hypothetical protein